MSNIVNLPPNTQSGEYKGFLHTEGGIQVIVDGGQHVEVEKNEYSICRAAMDDNTIYKFQNKTNKQILEKLFREDGCVFEQGKENAGNFIICRLVVLDHKPRNISGTVKDIVNILQKEKACRLTNDYSKRKLGGIFKKVDVKSENLKERIALVEEMFKETPTDKLKDRLELLNEMLHEDCGCSHLENGGEVKKDKIKILYLHGLGATPESDHVNILYSDEVDIISPTLYYGRHLFKELEKFIKKEKITCVIGHSMGGYLAYHLSLKHDLHCLLFNPSLELNSYNMQPIKPYRAKFRQTTKRMAVVGLNDDVCLLEYAIRSFKRADCKMFYENIGHDIPDEIKKNRFDFFIPMARKRIERKLEYEKRMLNHYNAKLDEENRGEVEKFINGGELYYLSYDTFSRLSDDKQKALILNELENSKIHNFLNSAKKPLKKLVEATQFAINLYARFSKESPIDFFEKIPTSICFHPEQKNIKSIGFMPALINYFAHIISASVQHTNDRYYDYMRASTVDDWFMVLNAPDKKYIQFHENEIKIVCSRDLYNPLGVACFILTLELIEDNLLRVHTVIPAKSKDSIKGVLVSKIDENKKNVTQWVEVRSLKNLSSVIASSRGGGSEKEDAFRSSTDTNIRQKSDSANNSEEKNENSDNIDNSGVVLAEGGDVKSKKIIRRNLPINKEYKLIDSFYTGGIIDNPMTCENCGRPIANVAVIKDEDGKSFDVGMDCAETLSSIKNSMEFTSVQNHFQEAASIRNKIRKAVKGGSSLVVENTPRGTVYFVARGAGLGNGGFQFSLSVEKMFCFKYLPDFKKDIINPEKNDFMPRYFDNHNFNFNFDYFKDKAVEPKEFIIDDYKVLVRRFDMPNYAEDGTVRNYNNTIEVKVLKGKETIGIKHTYMHRDVPSKIVYAINEYEFNKFGIESIKLKSGGNLKGKNESTEQIINRLKNDSSYQEHSKIAESERKTDSDKKHFSFQEIKNIADKVKGSVFEQDRNRYGNYDAILFSKYTDADLAIKALRKMGYSVSEREQNTSNAYFKFKVGISKSDQAKEVIQTPIFNDETDRTTIGRIAKVAMIEYNPNPSFISFKALSNAAARSATRKLIDAGYDAKVVESVYVKVSKDFIDKKESGGNIEKTKKTDNFHYFGTDLTSLMFADKSGGFNVVNFSTEIPEWNDNKIMFVVLKHQLPDVKNKIKIHEFHGVVIPKELAVAEKILRKNNLKNISYFKSGGDMGDYENKFYNESLQQYFLSPIDKTKKANDLLLLEVEKLDGGLQELMESLPTEIVPLEKIVPTQEGINTERFDSVVSADVKYLPLLIKIGDLYYIEDGHHRIIRNIKEGKAILVKVFDSNKEPSFLELESQGKVHRIMKQAGDEDFVELGKAPIIISVKKGTTYEYRKDAKEELKKLQNSYVTNKHTGEKIYFTKLSINELLFDAGANKLRALFHIKEIIENATPVSVEEIKKSNNALKRNSDFLYNMESMIMIDGQWFNYCFKTFVKLDEEKNKIMKVVIYSGHLPKEKPI